MNDTNFCSMNPIYKRERGVFWNNVNYDVWSSLKCNIKQPWTMQIPYSFSFNTWIPIFLNKNLLKKKKMSLIFIRNQATWMELIKSKQPTKMKYSTNTQIDLSMKIKIINWQDQSLQMHMGSSFPSNKQLKRTIDLNF